MLKLSKKMCDIVDDNQIAKIENLEKNTSLKKLNLANNTIRNISGLDKLNRL